MSANLTTKLTTARYGTLQPQIEVRLPKGTHYRALNATLHRLAADIECATPENEGWVVTTEFFCDDRGVIALELADGTAAEAQRGMAILAQITTAAR